jgi:hypothetical protein
MAKHVFENEPTEELDIIAACRLLYSLFHNCFGKIDEVVPPIVHLICAKMSSEQSTESTLRNIFGVIASAFHYNPVITIGTMEKLGCTEAVFKLWMSDLTRFKSLLDKKMFVLGVMSLLKIPSSNLPLSLQTHLKLVIQAAMKVLADSIQIGKNQSEEEEEEEDEDFEKYEQLLEQGGYDSNEDAEDVPDDKYLAILRELKAEAEFNSQYMYDEDGGEEYSSMLDEVDEVAFFLQTLQGMYVYCSHRNGMKGHVYHSRLIF